MPAERAKKKRGLSAPLQELSDVASGRRLRAALGAVAELAHEAVEFLLVLHAA